MGMVIRVILAIMAIMVTMVIMGVTTHTPTPTRDTADSTRDTVAMQVEGATVVGVWAMGVAAAEEAATVVAGVDRSATIAHRPCGKRFSSSPRPCLS